MSAHDSDEHYDIEGNAPHGFDDTPPRDSTILVWTLAARRPRPALPQLLQLDE